MNTLPHAGGYTAGVGSQAKFVKAIENYAGDILRRGVVVTSNEWHSTSSIALHSAGVAPETLSFGRPNHCGVNCWLNGSLNCRLVNHARPITDYDG